MKAGDLLQQVRFPEFGLDRWRLAAEKALGGAAFEDALVARTDDGIRIEPLMPRAQDASPRAVRTHPLSPWIVTQRIDDPDPYRANRQALEDIEQGATGIALVFEGAPNAFGYGLPAKPESVIPRGAVFGRYERQAALCPVQPA